MAERCHREVSVWTPPVTMTVGKVFVWPMLQGRRASAMPVIMDWWLSQTWTSVLLLIVLTSAPALSLTVSPMTMEMGRSV